MEKVQICTLAVLFLAGSCFSQTIQLCDGNSDNPDDIGFYLYQNGADLYEESELVYLDAASVRESGYNAALPVLLLTHGFTQSRFSQFPYYVKKAYLTNGYASNYNIIAVDWSKLAGQYNTTNLLIGEIATLPCYIAAYDNVPIVGTRIAQFLVFLQQNNFLSAGGNGIRLVGQSLGAHISGFAGRTFHTLTSAKIFRITGTDPAGPLFDGIDTDDRLDPTDATFVDCYHTNEGVMGYITSLCTTDFVINNGVLQPPCNNLNNVTDLFCSHNLAPRYFSESVGNPSIVATKKCYLPPVGGILTLTCLSPANVVFGENVPTSTTGTYQLNMNSYYQ